MAWDEFDEQDRNIVSLYLPAPLPSRISSNAVVQEDGDAEWEDESSDDEAAAEESIIAIDRVLNRYQNAVTLAEGDDEFDKREAERLRLKMDEWKRNYYKVSTLHSVQSHLRRGHCSRIWRLIGQDEYIIRR